MISERVIMGSIILVACLIPIVIMKLRSISEKKKIIDLLNNLAQKNNNGIDIYDQWNRSAIALSTKDDKLFWIALDNKEEKSKVFDLSLFNHCRVINDDAKAANRTHKLTTGVLLELTGTESIEHVCFYNTEKDGDLIDDELTLASKWCKIIEQRLAVLAGHYLSIK